MAVLFKNVTFLLLLQLYFLTSEAATCRIGIVPNITVTSTQIQWAPAVNPSNCTVNQYIINIFDSEDGSQLQFQTSSSILSYTLPALDMCKTYTFEVHALTSQNILGPSERVSVVTPPGTNMNLTVNVHNVTLLNGQINLIWNQVNTEVTRCISYYRVVYWDENNSPKDVYVPSNNYTLKETLVPCMEYNFQVSAIVTNPDREGPLTEVSWSGYSAVANPPTLVNIVPSNSTANMTWRVPGYSENRCPLVALVVNTLGLPANASNTRVAIQDSALRPNVGVYLQRLTANTVYTSHVSLLNSAGSSKNVTVTFQTSDTFVFDYERDLIYY